MRLLLVEDKDSFRRLLVQALERTSWEVLAVGDPLEALTALDQRPFEVLVTDLRLPSMSGLELLKRAKRLRPALRSVLMSAFGEPKDIVEAIHSGADDFLPKPFDLDHFQSVLDRLRALASAPPPDPREPWIACSPAMATLSQGLGKIADSRVPVIFQGEQGVGKARASRRLHTLRHASGPYLALSASTLGPEGPSSHQLSLVQNGSLYLADLESLPETHRPGLLRAMGSPEGRPICWMGGTAGPVPESLRLHFGILAFDLPPLRQRREDVVPLSRAFLEMAARQTGRSAPLLERTHEKELLQRPWRGNARELAWCIHQALCATEGPILAPLPPQAPDSGGTLCLPWPEADSLESMLERVRKQAEAQLLRRALAAHDQDAVRCAAALGLTPRGLAQRLREHRIPLDHE